MFKATCRVDCVAVVPEDLPFDVSFNVMDKNDERVWEFADSEGLKLYDSMHASANTVSAIIAKFIDAGQSFEETKETMKESAKETLKVFEDKSAVIKGALCMKHVIDDRIDSWLKRIYDRIDLSIKIREMYDYAREILETTVRNHETNEEIIGGKIVGVEVREDSGIYGTVKKDGKIYTNVPFATLK